MEKKSQHVTPKEWWMSLGQHFSASKRFSNGEEIVLPSYPKSILVRALEQQLKKSIPCQKEQYPIENLVCLMSGQNLNVQWNHFNMVMNAVGSGPLFVSTEDCPSRFERIKPLLVGKEWFLGIFDEKTVETKLLSVNSREGNFALIMGKDGFILYMVHEPHDWLETATLSKKLIQWDCERGGFMVKNGYSIRGPYETVVSAVEDHCKLTSKSRFSPNFTSNNFGRYLEGGYTHLTGSSFSSSSTLPYSCPSSSPLTLLRKSHPVASSERRRSLPTHPRIMSPKKHLFNAKRSLSEPCSLSSSPSLSSVSFSSSDEIAEASRQFQLDLDEEMQTDTSDSAIDE